MVDKQNKPKENLQHKLQSICKYFQYLHYMKAKYKICSIVKFTVLAEFSWEAWSVVYPFMLCTSCVSCVPLTKLGSFKFNSF